MIRTLGNASLVLPSPGDLKIDEELPFLGARVLVAPPGITCRNAWVCACVRFSEKADFHQILRVIYDHKTTVPPNIPIGGNSYFLLPMPVTKD